jgi:hypothetical protein
MANASLKMAGFNATLTGWFYPTPDIISNPPDKWLPFYL